MKGLTFGYSFYETYFIIIRVFVVIVIELMIMKCVKTIDPIKI